MLALLLENVGADKAVRLGNASIWRGAVAALREEHEHQETESPWYGVELPKESRSSPNGSRETDAGRCDSQSGGAQSGADTRSVEAVMITLQADFNHMDASGRLRLGDQLPEGDEHTNVPCRRRPGRRRCRGDIIAQLDRYESDLLTQITLLRKVMSLGA